MLASLSHSVAWWDCNKRLATFWALFGTCSEFGCIHRFFGVHVFPICASKKSRNALAKVRSYIPRNYRVTSCACGPMPPCRPGSFMVAIGALAGV